MDRSCRCRRRHVLAVLGAALVHGLVPCRADADTASRQFIDEAHRMKAEAVARGDQPYGAVIVRDGRIIGHGPSRVVTDRNPDAHAERVALWDAQRQAGTSLLDGAVIYSTSIPCAICQQALARAGIARMMYGPSGTDGGKPALR
ncbi:MAG: deaminase [Hyphomicrobiaceae bacterium]